MSTIETFEKLGTGENTVVYRGYDTSLERNVAVKELDPVARSDVRRREQFYREAQFLAQHQDENILTVFSVDRERGWIVMELMKGTLASQVTSGPLAPDLVRSVLQQVLRALSFLHNRGKIHGKVRPSNMLINDAGQVKLSDFEETDPNGELRIPAGSKKYLAPELLRSEFGAFGPNLDLYCLGFTALELLKGPGFDSLFAGTGTDAIDADTAWMRWHTEEAELPSTGTLIPGLPEDLKVVIDKMLHKQVSERPQSAQEALNLLNDTPLRPVMIDSTIPTIPTAADHPPIAAMPATPATYAPPPRTTKSSAAGKGKSKDKVNDFLGRPYVLYPLCALMLIAAVFVGLKLRGGGNESELQVKLLVEPKDASVKVDGKAVSLAKDGTVPFTPGKHKIALSKQGFKSHEQEVEISADMKEIGPISLTKLPVEEVKKVVKKDPLVEKKLPIVEPIVSTLQPTMRSIDFEIEPADAVVTVAGKPVRLAKGKGRLEVPQDAALALNVSHPMAQPFAQEFQPLDLDGVFNKITVKLKPLSTPPVETTGKLPEGLVPAEGADIDERWGVPQRVRVAALEDKAPLELVLIDVAEGTIGVDGPRMPGEVAGQKVVQSKPYYMAITETTNEQYAVFAEDKGDEAAGTKWRETWEKADSGKAIPVVDVSWDQAAAFCAWAGGQLPTENAWELAVRGSQDQGFPYPWGTEPADATRCNLFFGEADGENEYRLVAVTDLPLGATSSGLLNMLGNVAEWCQEKYVAGEGETPDSPEFADQYVVRGCSSAKSAAEDARVTYRAPEKAVGAQDVGVRLFIPLE